MKVGTEINKYRLNYINTSTKQIRKSSSPSSGSRRVPWLGEVSKLVFLCCPLPRLSTGWLVSLVLFSDMTGPGPFHFSTIADYSYDFCPLPDSDVGLSILVRDVEYASFHFGLCGRECVMCLVGQCPCIYTQDVYACLFKQMTRLLLKICRCLAYAVQPAMLIRWMLWLGSFPRGCSFVPGSHKHYLSEHCSRLLGCCLRPSPLSLRCSDPFSYFHQIVLEAYVVVIGCFCS